jgi:FKBP-type peptidyl-prolyl cis-trans isomerase
MRILFFSLLLAGCETQDAETPVEEAANQGAEGKPEAVSYAPPEDVAGPPADAITTESGLAYKVIRKGTGTTHPTKTSEVEVHYTGWQTDGTMFDSSHKRSATIKFALNKVIAGWTEGVALMVEGEKARLWIPEALAYKGRPGSPSGMLVFDVELVSIIPSISARFPAPVDVAAPPPDAKRTASGLAYRVIKAGVGSVHPTATSRVQVHYTGWQTDGTTFDSSYKRGKPAAFPLNGVIPGWTEGVQLMVNGETTRFWIPEELAYKGRPGRPSGMLVFDIELLEIQ